MQKFSLIHNCHFKFAESNDAKRTNRDRPGGHVCGKIAAQGWKDYCGPHARKFAKKVFAKAARRESKRIIAEGVADWNETRERLFYAGFDLYPNTARWDWYDPLGRFDEALHDDSDFDADWDEYREEYGDMKPTCDPYWDDEWGYDYDYEPHLDALDDDDDYGPDIWDGVADLDEGRTITITVSEYNALRQLARMSQ